MLVIWYVFLCISYIWKKFKLEIIDIVLRMWVIKLDYGGILYLKGMGFKVKVG